MKLECDAKNIYCTTKIFEKAKPTTYLQGFCFKLKKAKHEACNRQAPSNKVLYVFILCLIAAKIKSNIFCK